MTTQQTTLFAWGRQRQGQCGSPEIVTDRTWPQEVEHFPMTPKIIACANERSIVVTDDNQIFSVGQGLMVCILSNNSYLCSKSNYNLG